MKRITVGALGLLCALALAFSIQGDVSAASLSGSVRIATQLNYTSALDLTTGQSSVAQTYTLALTSGTGANQADVMFTDQRTLAASTAEDLDVSGGALTDAFGTTFTIATLKALIVCAAAANTNNVQVMGDAAGVLVFADATDVVSVKPGGCFAITVPGTGYTVTNSTADVIQVANSGAGTSVTYDIYIIGTSS